MKKRIFGLLAALALCLALLPGAALAEGEAEVSIGGTTLWIGRKYVPEQIELPSGEIVYTVTMYNETAGGPLGDDYLEFDGSTVTVHGRISTNRGIAITGNVTITGEAGSSLEVTGFGITTYINGTLTLDGSVDFTPRSLQGNDPSTSRLTTTSGYSGHLVIEGSSQTVLDVKNSASIEIGVVTYPTNNPPQEPMTLKSAGDITFNNASLQWPNAVLEGENVSLSTNSGLVFKGNSLTIRAEKNVTIESKGPYAIMGSAEISAGGTVDISSAGAPVTAPDGGTGGLTVKNAQNVTITGESGRDAFFPVPVTFENCGNVTVTDTGTGDFLGTDGSIDSAVPIRVTKNSEEKLYADGILWDFGGNYIDPNPRNPNPVAWMAGDGWVFWEPPKDGNPARLTLDNVEYPDGNIIIDTDKDVSVEVKGRNRVGCIATSSSSMELNIRDGGTLNALVDEVDEDQRQNYTVYGKAELPNDFYAGASDWMYDTHLTIPQGTELTIPSGRKLFILDTAYLENQGTLVNNGTVILIETAAEGDAVQTIKSLGLTGTGTVVVGELDTGNGNLTVQESYTNSGLKLLEPAGDADGKLDLSDASADDTNWEDQGYKWEDVQTDDDGKITSGTLVLAPGFNAEEVALPDAEVEIVSEGECLIGELTVSNPQKTALTLSGPGPLNIQQHVEICGGTGNSLTVAQGAQVQVSGGFTVGAAGGVNGTVTVNGTLTSAGDSTHAAVLTGKLEVGSSGTLRVSGQTGVSLGGWSITGDAGNKDFAGALTVQPGGRFEARCDPAVILASADPADIREDSEEEVIVFPNGYLPSDCVLEFTNGKKTLIISGDGTLFTISSDNVPLPPASGHTHKWAEEWTVSPTYHWHECAASGCPVTEASEKDGYGAHVFGDGQDTTCDVCGYIRSFPEPSEPSGPSGGDSGDSGDSGDNSGGFFPGGFFPGGGKRAASVDPAAVWALLAALEKEACPSRAFSDLDAGAWYHEAVDFVLWAGLMNGYSDGTFRPGGTVSRAMLAQILYNQAGRPAVTGGKAFSDVTPGAWYAPAVTWAAQRGIVSGYADGTFRPNSGVTREQMAAMLWRCAGSPASSRALNFTDADRAGDYALPALRWAVERGVMNGKSGGVLDPQGQATRAQTAQMLKNLMKS